MDGYMYFYIYICMCIYIYTTWVFYILHPYLYITIKKDLMCIIWFGKGVLVSGFICVYVNRYNNYVYA